MTRNPAAKNVFTGVLLALVGAGTLWATAGFPRGVAAAADAALLPRTLAVLLILIGLAVTAGALLAIRSGTVAADDAEGIPIDMPVDIPDELLHHEDTDGPPEVKIIAALAALILVYAWAAFNVGFIVSTAVVVIAAALLLGRSRHARSLLVLVVFAVVVAVAVWTGFFELLNVRPPRTPLP